MKLHTNYLGTILDKKSFRLKLQEAKKIIKESRIQFDAIAVSGNSGTLFGGALANALNKSIILVRKPTENSHSMYLVEADLDAKRWIFVDDFISMGVTFKRVYDGIKRLEEDRGIKFEYVARYMYADKLLVRKENDVRYENLIQQEKDE